MEYSKSTTTDTASNTGIVDRVRERATAQLSSQKDRATDGIGSIAQAVRQSTQQLRDQQHDTIAQYVEKAADQLERFSAQLRNRDITDLMQDVQRFARQQPALFIGSAFAIGLIGARFLKSSNESRQYGALQRYDTGATPYTAGYPGDSSYPGATGY